MDTQVELLKRRLDRERTARKQAEQIMEEKSRELYIRSQELERMIAAERLARGEVEIMLEAFDAFTARLDFDEIVAHLEAFMKRLVPFDRSEVYFFDGDVLRLHRLGGEVSDGKRVGETITPAVSLAEMRQTGRPLLVPDTGAIAPSVSGVWRISPQATTWMAVLMSAHGQQVGCITMGSRETDAFGPSMMRLVQAIANEAAVAFVNARLFQEVWKHSILDPLTGLLNRRCFNTAAQVEFDRSRRYALSLSAIMMDIDHFKRVNDRYGHAEGDRVLVAVATVCGCGLRSMDLFARYGGEEFCILLPETPLEGALNLAERLRADVAGMSFETNTARFAVTASFGVATFQACIDSVGTLLIRSDQALYDAKRGGRNRVAAWSQRSGITATATSGADSPPGGS